MSAFGDVVHVLPSLAALRAAFPQAKIGWAVEQRVSHLLVDHPMLDRLHVIPRRAWTADVRRGRGLALMGGLRRKVAELRAERYEVAIDFQSNFRSSMCCWLSGARKRIGQPRRFSKEGSSLLFTDTPTAVAPEVHKIDRNLALLTCLGIKDTRLVEIPSKPVGDMLSTLPPKGDRPWVLVHPGVSAFGAIKAWRPERFAALARGLVEGGAEVFFSWGGAGEQAQAERLLESAPGARMCPRTDIAQLTELLRMADLFVGVDSGPLHLAAVLGIPVLGLYGPKHVGTYGPYWPAGRVVRADYPCSPCRHRRCPLPEASSIELANGTKARISPCMDTIDVEQVLQSALEILAG